MQAETGELVLWTISYPASLFDGHFPFARLHNRLTGFITNTGKPLLRRSLPLTSIRHRLFGHP